MENFINKNNNFVGNNIEKIRKEIIELVKNRTFFNNLDIDYINENLRKKSDYLV